MTAFRTILIFFIILSAATNRADAQHRYKLNPMNAVFGEFFLLTPDQDYYRLAVNYERLFSPRGTFSGRIGVIPDFKDKILILPLTVQGYTPGGKQHHIEYGGGIMPCIDYYDSEKIRYNLFPVLMGGYRYQRGTGLILRATANVILYPFILNPSVSIGYQF